MNISFVNHLCWNKYQFAVTAVTPAKPRGSFKLAIFKSGSTHAIAFGQSPLFLIVATIIIIFSYHQEQPRGANDKEQVRLINREKVWPQTMIVSPVKNNNSRSGYIE